MNKLDMQSPDFTEQNIQKLAELFPNCVTEAKNAEGELQKSIDFDLLKQELSANIVEGPRERYQLNWPGKREALLTANTPISKTLRPCREESVDFDNTENLFIEGDNLDALKLLQETYLGKVKMIYIDPPYNTGKDFIYSDNFTVDKDDYDQLSEQKDEDGGRLVVNTESNGRFHSDWLDMMYPRLKLARNLLRDDGVIFISIHDKEAHNMRKILDELFGADNFIVCLIWDKNHSAQAGVFKVYHEYIYVYAKNIFLIDTPSTGDGKLFEAGAMKRESSRHPMSEFTFPAGVRFNAKNNTEFTSSWGGIEKVELIAGRMICKNGKLKEPVTLRAAYTQKDQMQQYFYGDKDSLIDSRGQKISEFYFTSTGKIKIIKERGVETPQTTLKDYGSQGVISTNLASLFGLTQTPIDNPKPKGMLQDFINWFTSSDDIILDFFAGSATTAHAVMQLNAEDGGQRKFIMVQLPEVTDEKPEVFKAGYKTIAEISKERIRRAGNKILEELSTKDTKDTKSTKEKEKTKNKASPGEADDFSDFSAFRGQKELDIGFRVLKVDSSNMKDVYYAPDAMTQGDLIDQADNIKEDRSAEDLLFQVLLDWGVDLTLPIVKEKMSTKSTKSTKGKDKTESVIDFSAFRGQEEFEVFFVDENALCACFDKDINEELVKQIAKREPLRAVFRDAGYGSDSTKINIKQIFKLMSPHTEVKAI